MSVNRGLINKKYVHKCNEHNVFIYDSREMLPRTIEKNQFEILINSLSQEERDYLLNFFIFFDHCSSYVLHTSSLKIKGYIESYLLNNSSHHNHWQFLNELTGRSSYKNAYSTGCIYCKDDSEGIETKVLSILGLRHLHIDDVNRLKIYNIMKKSCKISWESEFLYSRMHVTTNHSFFFEHPNEHVPGIMLVEAIRQFGLACSHLFFHVPLQEVQFVLSDMALKFVSYLELNFPINFEGRMGNAKYHKSGILSCCDFTTNVYQKNELACVASTTGKFLSSELFHVLRRNTHDMKNQLPRFIPHSDTVAFLIKDTIKSEFAAVNLINISENGFCVQHDKQFEYSDFYEFSLITSIGNINSSCYWIWQKESDGKLHSGFKMHCLCEKDKVLLSQILKVFCFVKEDREIL